MNGRRLSWLAGAGALLGGSLVAKWLLHRTVDGMVDRITRRLLSEPYESNLWELVAGFGHNPVMQTMENELRAHHGSVLQRPMGTWRRFGRFSSLMFNPAQFYRTPLSPKTPVSMETVLGPRAGRPLVLQIPLLVSAMGYGVGVNERVAIALARGAALAGTASNSGQGPLLPEVRRAARWLVVQYTGATWNRDPAVIRQADMVEVRFGQGAWGALGEHLPPHLLTRRSQRLMGAVRGDGVTISSAVEGVRTVEHLAQLIRHLRDLTAGAPIGVKMAATHHLEAELDMVLAAGVDVIAIDGAEGGSHVAPPILADDFGLPTFYALVRAVRHLERRGQRGRVSLIISGGLGTPGDYLKCLALGADAVYLGTTALFATTHEQVTRALPWEPATQLIYPTGKLAGRFDVEAGARSLARFLRASAEEMAVAARALGKRSLRDVSREDLMALDRETALMTGVPLAWAPPDGWPQETFPE